jgi:hypothetical protein
MDLRLSSGLASCRLKSFVRDQLALSFRSSGSERVFGFKPAHGKPPRRGDFWDKKNQMPQLISSEHWARRLSPAP